MHLEYRYCLESLLPLLAGELSQTEVLSEQLELSASGAVREVLANIGTLNFVVEDCPPEIQGVLAANLAFVLAAKLKAACGGKRLVDYGPGAIASRMLELQQKSLWVNRFQISLGAEGFLNAEPSSSFVVDYFAAVLDSIDWGADCDYALGDSELFVGRKVFSRQTSFLFGGKSEREIVLQINPMEIFKRATASDNLDSQELAKIIKQREDFAGGIVLRDDLLMLLALEAESEIELWPYLRQYVSWQNVPQFFRKFSADWKSFVNLFKQQQVAEISLDEKRLALSKLVKDLWLQRDIETLTAVEEFRRCLRLLMCFRGRLNFAVESKRPELVIGLLLQSVRAFYSFYHRPEVRAMPYSEGLAEECGIVPNLIVAFGLAVEEVLGTLEFSCENSAFVLQE